MKSFIEKQLFREGILKPGPFTDSYDLRCYEPTDSLRPFVEHYFISRRRPQYDVAYIGNDVLSQPVVTLFIKPNEAYFEGPTTKTRTLIAKDSPIYMGVQFRPGGFYPFWKRPLRNLTEKRIPATDILPTHSTNFANDLLTQNNQDALTLIDTLLMSKCPPNDPTIEFINQVVTEIEAQKGMITVTDLAETFHTSERTLQHLFQTYVGVGVKWTIMRTRFLEAIKFIRIQDQPDWTVIAAEYGYSDQSHFINDFKKLVGQSPTHYMKHH